MSEPSQGRFFLWLLGAALLFLIGAIAVVQWRADVVRIDPDEAVQVARGTQIYSSYCAACHGANLDGQPDWRQARADGRMPAPPHDESGHTWHHPDDVLFGITKYGLVPGKYAPPGYESDMPAFGTLLDDAEIRAVLAYIKSSWGPRERAYQARIDEQARSLPRRD
ncbi:MAG: c-type cytochrome [Pseudazoarcus pumilus]|nr:c-type cytochrome [Pseudazoarcus pumilus]